MSLIDTIAGLELKSITELSEAEQLGILSIRNHPEVRKHMYTTHQISSDEHLSWIEQLKADSQTRYFAVFHVSEIVGAANLNAISVEHKRANWGFYLDPSAQGASIGTALGVKVLDHAFEALSKLNGEVLDFNQRSIAFHKKLGFKQEGVRRRHVLRDGQYRDVVMLGITSEEWRESRTKLLRGNCA